MIIIKEFFSWLTILAIIIFYATVYNTYINAILFTLFYIVTYILSTNNYLSILGVTIIGLIFDSINNNILGFSSTILIFNTLLHIVFYKENSSFTFIIYYILAVLNILFIVIYTKIILLYFDLHFINLITFIIVGIISIFILYPVILITNKIIYNAK